MSLPGNRRPSTASRRFSSLFKSPSSSASEKQALLPACRRPSPPVTMRDTYGTSSLSSSSNSGSCKGSDSSPTLRRPMKYTLCSDNHGINPPTPEQYLTPLQQKEVCIRHLRAQLKDAMDHLQDRDMEIEELRSQLSRMQEDWIEEECHRVEAQLALKEARKEIKQLKQVIDTVKNNLPEKDMGIQKYFVDINIQNRKLETLLHSMEIAQNGTLRDEGAAESVGGSPARSLTRSSTYTKLSEHTTTERSTGDSQSVSAEDTADSGFFVAADNTLNQTDFLARSSALILGTECYLEDESLHGPQLPTSSTSEKLQRSSAEVPSCAEVAVQASCMAEQAVQTECVQYHPNPCNIMQKVQKSQACTLNNTSAKWVSEMEEVGLTSNTHNQNLTAANTDTNSAEISDQNPQETFKNHHDSLWLPASGTHSPDSVICTMEEESAEVRPEATSTAPKTYWSRHFIVDLLAVVVPVVPTVAWLCRTQRRQDQPIYNISSLLRGCCTVALHSIRRINCRSTQP
ncbi:syntaphilin isoform X2 [Microcaecilia unicolor]|uniref:Syntaphilin isoform X2 n=1 Tax=Microcaecilia unicolor TaxID=1415580 RepID=A0A6P7YVR3_9AMPH|nr:syntaphilin isoform X2 [Microcaecilia unicolor]